MLYNISTTGQKALDALQEMLLTEARQVNSAVSLAPFNVALREVEALDKYTERLKSALSHANARIKTLNGIPIETPRP